MVDLVDMAEEFQAMNYKTGLMHERNLQHTATVNVKTVEVKFQHNVVRLVV